MQGPVLPLPHTHSELQSLKEIELSDTLCDSPAVVFGGDVSGDVRRQDDHSAESQAYMQLTLAPFWSRHFSGQRQDQRGIFKIVCNSTSNAAIRLSEKFPVRW